MNWFQQVALKSRLICFLRESSNGLLISRGQSDKVINKRIKEMYLKTEQNKTKKLNTPPACSQFNFIFEMEATLREVVSFFKRHTRATRNGFMPNLISPAQHSVASVYLPEAPFSAPLCMCWDYRNNKHMHIACQEMSGGETGVLTDCCNKSES